MSFTSLWSGRSSPIPGGSSSLPHGNPDISSSPSSSLARSRSRALAWILQGDGGNLVAELDSGRIEDLAEGLQGLSSSTHSRLRNNFGASLAELSSLSGETDSELFYQGLFALGSRLEERASPEVVQRIYNFLVHSPESPSGVATRARTRLQVLSGTGPFMPQFEYGLSRVVSTSTSAEFLLGMTAGGLAFRVGRLWGMQSLIGAGLRGRSLSVLASATGLTTEAGAFLLTSRGIRTWNGHASPWTAENLGREYTSTLFLLGGLRLSGWGMGTAYRGIQNNLSGSLLARIPEGAFRQAGMAGGLFGVHYAAMGLGLEERKSLPTLLAQVGGEWVTFNVGGRVAHRLLGPRVAGLQRYLDLQGRALEAASGRGPSYLDSLLHPILNFGISRSAFASEVPLGENLVFSVGYNNGGRGAHAGAESYTPPRPVSEPVRRPPSPVPPPSGPREIDTTHRIWVGSQIELIEWIRGNRGNFHQRVREDHIFFRMVAREQYNSETVLAELNRLPFLREIYRGRRIQIGFDDGSPSVEFVRLANRFFEWRRSGTEEIASETEASGIVSQELRDIQTRMDRISSPRLPAVNPAAESTTAPGVARSRPSSASRGGEFGFVRGPEGLLNGLARILRSDQGPENLEILGYFPRGLHVKEINAMRNRLSELPLGRVFTFHDGRAHLSYRFERTSREMIPQMKVTRWMMPENREEINAGGMAEVMMGVLRFRNYYPPEPQRLRVLHSGSWNPDLDGPKILELLNLESGILFREIHVKFVPPQSQSGLPLTQRFFRNEAGNWRLE